MPNWFVLIRYAKFAGVPLEFIVDDEIDVDYFKYYLTVVEERRRQLKQRQESTEQRVVLYWHGPKP
jgi:hypothetical protein